MSFDNCGLGDRVDHAGNSADTSGRSCTFHSIGIFGSIADIGSAALLNTRGLKDKQVA